MENKTKESTSKSTREQALEWWNNLSESSQWDLMETFLPKIIKNGEAVLDGSKHTDEWIEKIWAKEIQQANQQDFQQTQEEIRKPNAKQFDAKLAANYLNKFNIYDKCEFIGVACLQLPLTIDELSTITNILKKVQFSQVNIK